MDHDELVELGNHTFGVTQFEESRRAEPVCFSFTGTVAKQTEVNELARIYSITRSQNADTNGHGWRRSRPK